MRACAAEPSREEDATWSIDRLLVPVVVALVVVALLYYTPPGRALIALTYRNRAAKLSARRQAVVLLRVAGPPESRVRWRYGLVTYFPGRVDFVSYVGGLWFLKRRPLFYEVVATATLEVAAIPPFTLDQALAHLTHLTTIASRTSPRPCLVTIAT